MTKSLIALAATLVVAATTFTATAEAGGCHNGGFRPHGMYGFHGTSGGYDHRAAAARRQAIAEKRAAIAAQKRAAAVAEKKAEIQKQKIAAAKASAARARVARAETSNAKSTTKANTSIASLAALDKPLDAGTAPEVADEVETNETAETATTEPVVAATAPATCKRYIASAGLTIDVACQD